MLQINSTTRLYNINPVADHSQIIQRAIRDLGNNGGGLVHLHQGNYLLNTNLRLSNGTFPFSIHLRGDSSSNTFLILGPQYQQLTRSGLIQARNLGLLMISQLTIDGQRHLQNQTQCLMSGIYAQGCDQVVINNVKTQNFPEVGIYIQGSDTDWTNQVRIRESLSSQNGWNGFMIDQVVHTQIHNCTSVQNDKHGFDLSSTLDLVSLNENQAINNGYGQIPGRLNGCGFNLQKTYPTSHINIISNLASSNSKAGICLNSVDNVTLMGNLITRESLCYHMVDTTSTEMRDNVCISNQQYVLVGTSTLTTNYNDYQINKNIYLDSSEVFLSQSICDLINNECIPKSQNIENYNCTVKFLNSTGEAYCQSTMITGTIATSSDESSEASWADILSDWRIYIPFIFSFVRYGQFLLLKVIPAVFFYRQLKYKPDHPLQTKDVTAVIAVHDPPPTFEGTLDHILNNRPGQIIVVGSGKFIETTRAIVAKVNAKIDILNEDRRQKRLALEKINNHIPIVDSQVDIRQVEPSKSTQSGYGGLIRMSRQKNDGNHIIQIEPKKLTNLMDKSYDAETQNITHIQVIREDLRGKRIALDRGIRATKTALVALIDDDIKWSPVFLQKLIAPFQHDERIAGVGCKQVARINGTFDLWGIMADMRLAVRFLELMATTTLDKGCSCLSGRTACYRTSVIQTDECYDYLVNEKFFGHKVISGDDKCLTRYVINQGHKTYHQLRDSCELVTSFETGWPFFLQMFRWARNTWRSDIKSLFIERKIWRNTPITAFIILDKMITPFIIMVGPILVIIGISLHGKRIAVMGWVIWLCFSRGLKLCYYLWEHPGRFWAIPFFVIFQYVASVARIWALCTLFEMKWGTKDITVKDGQVISDVDGKAVDDNPEQTPVPIVANQNIIELNADQFPQTHVDQNMNKYLPSKEIKNTPPELKNTPQEIQNPPASFHYNYQNNTDVTEPISIV